MFILGLLMAVLLGNAILGFFGKEPELSLPENLALSFLLGQAGVTGLLFWALWARLPYRFLLINLFILALFAWKILVLDRPQIKPFKLNFKPQALWLVLFLGVGCKIAYVAIEACSKPEYSWDACLNWTRISRNLFWINQINPLLTFKYLGGHYPQFIPLMHFWLFEWMGQANDQWSKIFLPVSLVCFLVLFYYGIRRFSGSVKSLFFVYLLLSAPFFLYLGTIGYADLPISLYFSLGVIFFYRWISEKSELYFWLFSWFISITTWIKLEGKPLFILGSILLLVYLWRDYQASFKTAGRKLAQFLAVFAVIGLPWQVYMFINRFPTREGLANFLPKFWVVILQAHTKLFLEGSWGIFWMIFAAAWLFFGYKLRTRENKYLTLTLLLFMGYILFIFLCTADGFDWFEVSFNRLWLSIYPVAVFTLAVIFPRFPSFRSGTKRLSGNSPSS